MKLYGRTLLISTTPGLRIGPKVDSFDADEVGLFRSCARMLRDAIKELTYTERLRR
jgi:hypothetical protein